MDSLYSQQSTVNSHQNMVLSSDSLHSVVVNLGVADNKKIPLGLNRAIHAQVLTWLKKGNPEISVLIHNSQQSPISISELIKRINSPITKSVTCQDINRLFFNVNFLQGYLVPILLKGIEEEKEIFLNNRKFTIIGVDTLPSLDSQAKSATYKELVENNSKFSREIKLKFVSPTSFKQNGCIQPFPLPELVFNNLLRRWNTFAPVEYHFPKVDWQGMTAAYDLKTKVIKKEVTEIGSVGWVRYVFKNEEQARVANVLANFANFSGVGRKTAFGMGRVFLLAVNS